LLSADTATDGNDDEPLMLPMMVADELVATTTPNIRV
jgi:hypothetical protein